MSKELGENLNISSIFKDKNSKLLEDKNFWRSLYPEEHEDGDIIEGLDKGYEDISGDGIVPTWDSTDHMHFMCKNCRNSVRIVSVQAKLTQGMPTIKFGGFCPNCGKGGSRKTYIRDSEPANYKATYFPLNTEDGELLHFSDKGDSYTPVKEDSTISKNKVIEAIEEVAEEKEVLLDPNDLDKVALQEGWVSACERLKEVLN